MAGTKPGSAEAMDAFMTNLADFPGGDLMAPHMADGPFKVTVVMGADDASVNWLAASLLHAYPYRPVRISDDPEKKDARLYVLPARAMRLAEWYEDGEVSFWLEGDFETTDAPPSEAELGEYVAGIYFGADADERVDAACSRIAARGYLDPLLEMLNARADACCDTSRPAEADYWDLDDINSHLQAFEAAMDTTTPEAP